MNHFEVKCTIRFYNTALITALNKQLEKDAGLFRSENEFLNHLVERGLEVHVKEQSAKESHEEQGDLYALMLKVFSNISEQIKKLHAQETTLEYLLCSVYHIVAALNNGETLFSEKIESGFYNNTPPWLKKIIDDLSKDMVMPDKK